MDGSGDCCSSHLRNTDVHDSARRTASRFQTSFDFSAWNSALFLAMDEDHPSVLANLVEDAVRVFLEESERHDPIRQ
jgi:hypothetical protein